jgi:hypothetical protein
MNLKKISNVNEELKMLSFIRMKDVLLVHALVTIKSAETLTL